MEQRTEEWFTARLGKVTASRVADVVAKTKSGYSTSRDNYMAELICERLTGTKGEFYQNAAMVWGTEQEPHARAAYEAAKGVLVNEVGFVPHALIDNAGASPDGLVGDDGLVEIKCPNTATHLDFLLTSRIPEKYVTQMMWQMACTERKWCDYVSYDPRLPEHMRMKIIRVVSDQVLMTQLENEVIQFLDELNIKISKLQTQYAEV
jgi:hypothetical protein